eukprot:SAG11_NODE_434_length_9506_cov_5.089295_4_plen_149_part_00
MFLRVLPQFLAAVLCAAVILARVDKADISVSKDPPVSAAETRERFLIILADDHPPVALLCAGSSLTSVSPRGTSSKPTLTLMKHAGSSISDATLRTKADISLTYDALCVAPLSVISKADNTVTGNRVPTCLATISSGGALRRRDSSPG